MSRIATKRNPPKPGKPARRPAQSDLNRVLRSTETRINRLVLRYSTGQVSAKEFTRGMSLLLENRHARAATLGRNRAGDYTGQNTDDLLYARAVMEGYPGDAGQNHYLKNFLSDLLSGRYTDEDGFPKVSQIQQRALSYTGRIVGTANETFVLSSVLYVFHWILGGVEEHCEDCPALARNSPYAWDRLPTVPKGNKTPCLFRCSCKLNRGDGVTSFYGIE